MARSRALGAVLAVALLAPLFMFGGRAFAIQHFEDKVSFGPVGITPGERGIVNVYAGGTADEPGDPNGTPWTFVVREFDSRGKLIQQRRLRLARGAIGSVPIAIQRDMDLTATPLDRRTFRVEIVAFNPQPDPPSQWSATLEVIDRLTDRTSLLLGGPDTLPAFVRTPRQ